MSNANMSTMTAGLPDAPTRQTVTAWVAVLLHFYASDTLKMLSCSSLFSGRMTRVLMTDRTAIAAGG
jgi:hypothetical protein